MWDFYFDLICDFYLNVLSSSIETLYNDVELNLKIVQTAAVLEIIHAAIGFVKSPVATTAMQGTVATFRLFLYSPVYLELYIFIFYHFFEHSFL